MRLSAVACAISLAAAAFASDDDWVYDTSKRADVTPVSSEAGTCAGLYAKARGFDDTDVGTDVDAWYWTRHFAECWIKCTPFQGGVIIIR